MSVHFLSVLTDEQRFVLFLPLRCVSLALFCNQRWQTLFSFEFNICHVTFFVFFGSCGVGQNQTRECFLGCLASRTGHFFRNSCKTLVYKRDERIVLGLWGVEGVTAKKRENMRAFENLRPS